MTTKHLKTPYPLLALLLTLSLLLAACGPAGSAPPLAAQAAEAEDEHATGGHPASAGPAVEFNLTTGFADGKLAFIGQGGAIDGVTNPDLAVPPGATVTVNLINGDGPEHDFAVPDLEVASAAITGQGNTTSVTFTVGEAGEYTYLCTIPGHREAGMHGLLIVGEEAGASRPAAPAGSQTAVSIARDPADLPGPLGDGPPQTLQIEIEAVEVEGKLTEGATYTYWTFDGQVPGPFLRVRVGDTVEMTLKNRADSKMAHSIDLHAVTGPGGGAAVTQVPPGGQKSFTFKALNPGLYVYHCATPMVAHHIASGMYGLILVEPEGGLAPVDREFYVMQGEIYIEGELGARGYQQPSIAKLLNETPDYVVFNGAAGALTGEYPMHASVGESVRIFFGSGGPNYTSAFHVIGEIFDRVYDQASTSAPLTDVQTTLVPPGGATIVEFGLEVPGRYILVDHALSRLERGAAGFLVVDGPENPEIFHSDEDPDGSH